MRRITLCFLLLSACAPLLGQMYNEKEIVNNLSRLCKTWGFLKYHHPAVLTGEQDWDQELFAMFDRLEGVESGGACNALLEEWVEKLGPIVVDKGRKTNDPASFKQVVNFDWINPEVFGEKLTSRLNDVRYAVRPDSNYYVRFAPDTRIATFGNENGYPDITPWEDPHYRFLTLCRAWNVIEYLYPYKYLTDKPWDSVLEEYIPLFLAADTRTEYLKTLLRFSAEICDSHVSIGHSKFNPFDQLFGLSWARTLPYFVKYIENNYVVTESFDDEKRIRPGDILVSFNHLKVDSLETEMRPYMAASNDGTYPNKIWRYFTITDRDTIDLTLIRDGNQIDLALPSLSWQDFYAKFNENPVEAVRMPDDGIVYIDLGSFQASQIPETVEKMSDAKGLILDLRTYPLEFIVHKLGAYLVESDSPFCRFTITNFADLGTFNDNNILTLKSDGSNSFKNKVVILVDSGTMSQGEFTAMAWRTNPRATIIGSRTAGADGNVTRLVLPGGFNMGFSGAGVYYPDGGETQRVGIRIDEEVRPTIRGIREGRDELLEYAIDLIKK